MEAKTEYDYIYRTQEILKQYETLNLPKNKQYNVTLLINACICLLFIGKENKWLPDFDMGLDQYIKRCKKQKTETRSQAICRHIRNSIAHFNLVTIGETIDTLHLEDCNKNKKVNFEMTIPVEQFKEFLLKISTYILEHKK